MALAEMALGKAVCIENGEYGPNDGECDTEQWMEDLEGIAAVILTFFRPGDGKI